MLSKLRLAELLCYWPSYGHNLTRLLPRPQRPIAEFTIVRITRSIVSEGFSVPKDTCGTIVAVYDRGTAYAVKVADLPGGPEGVTLQADQIEPMH